MSSWNQKTKVLRLTWDEFKSSKGEQRPNDQIFMSQSGFSVLMKIKLADIVIVRGRIVKCRHGYTGNVPKGHGDVTIALGRAGNAHYR